MFCQIQTECFYYNFLLFNTRERFRLLIVTTELQQVFLFSFFLKSFQFTYRHQDVQI